MTTTTEVRGNIKIGSGVCNESLKALQRVHSLVPTTAITINYQSSEFESEQQGLEYCMEASRVVPNLVVNAVGHSQSEYATFVNGKFLILDTEHKPEPPSQNIINLPHIIMPPRRHCLIGEILKSPQMPTDPDVKNCIVEAWEESPQTIHFYEEDGVFYYDDYEFGKPYPISTLRYSSEIGLHVFLQ
jgi:hypothetical protein